MAAPLDRRRTPAAPGRLLAAGPGRHPRGDRPADRPAAPASAGLCRRPLPGGARRRAQQPARRAEPAPRRDALHDADGRLGDAAVAPVRAAGPRHRQPDRRPHPQRNRTPDRLLRQHARAALPADARADRRRPARLQPAAGPGRPAARRPAVRADRRSGAAAAQPGACADLPGAVRLAERAAGPPRATGTDRIAAQGPRRGLRQVRPHTDPAGGRRPHRGHAGIRHRAL